MLMRPLMLQGAAAAAAGLRPQDVYATSLYTGNGGTQTITTGLDMLGFGGLAWDKGRTGTSANILVDTARGGGKLLLSNSTGAEQSAAAGAQSFLSNGYTTFGSDSGSTNVGWSFRRAPKFFDIVTYMGDGTSGRQIPHGLGAAPGMVIVKRRNAAQNWHVSFIKTGNYLILNSTSAADEVATFNQGFVDANSTTFGLNSYQGANAAVNASGGTYVAYLFAHDPDPSSGIIQCGTSTANGAGAQSIPHGWANGAQWAMMKRADGASNWSIYDTARTPGFTGSDALLLANLSDAETSSDTISQSGGVLTRSAGTGGGVYVWVVIRAPI